MICCAYFFRAKQSAESKHEFELEPFGKLLIWPSVAVLLLTVLALVLMFGFNVPLWYLL